MNDLSTGDPLSTRRKDRWRGRVSACVCALALVPAGWVAWQEEQTSTLIAAMVGTPDMRAATLQSHASTDPATLNDRGNAALAQAALTEAATLESPGLKQLYLNRAASSLARLSQQRADWAPQLVLTARYEQAVHGATTPKALAAYAQSYRVAPYQFAMARWRIAFGADNWAALDQPTRHAMIEEARWYTTYDGGSLRDILAILGDSPAGMSFVMTRAAARE